ncbi:MAG: carboxypeptidase regulatory-like domain-containing protein, partial [Gemmatimonadetes bacterium]|nr:carboxypeptidase regulatory-like domain-containing protein [Gemmatimonadota bacterium]
MKLGVLLLAAALPAAAQTGKISGIVTNGRAAEAGVWVIAETEDLPTKFAKIVVTDDRGRFLIPELPKASYRVWVRGYGLVDSKKIKARLGDRLRLKAAIAPNEGSAAQYYPAVYWYSMLGIPGKGEFPLGKAASQPEWLNVVKTNGCVGCHALGTAATRTVPKALGHFDSSEEA